MEGIILIAAKINIVTIDNKVSRGTFITIDSNIKIIKKVSVDNSTKIFGSTCSLASL